MTVISHPLLRLKKQNKTKSRVWLPYFFKEAKSLKAEGLRSTTTFHSSVELHV